MLLALIPIIKLLKTAMQKLFFVAVCAVLLMGCSKNEPSVPSKYVSFKESLRGKYKIVSSTTEKPVDLNYDGAASTNLLSENPMVKESELTIVGLHSDSFEEKQLHYSISWPVECFFWRGTEAQLSVTRSDGYNIGIDAFCGEIDDDFKTVWLCKDFNRYVGNTLVDLESLVVEGNGKMTVTTLRKLLTSKGWITTKIVSTYVQYTNWT